jgi:hypothetical protein
MLVDCYLNLELNGDEGIEFLKTKNSLKRITIKEPFNLSALLYEIQQSQSHMVLIVSKDLKCSTKRTTHSN